MASKKRQKVIVCAGRRPPHPWEETGESILVGRYLGNGANGKPTKKTIENGSERWEEPMGVGFESYS